MNINISAVTAALEAVSPSVSVVAFHGDVTFVVPKEAILQVLAELKENPHSLCTRLSDITVIDWADKRGADRFELVYILYSMEHKEHLRVKCSVRADNPHIPTVVDIWEGANWYEREAYDMYGVIFDGHPDLRRFYMPEDFMDSEGEQLYPLRKDFPLMGIPGSLPLPEKN
jgi:NADH-quinone oxidoreductase subunit C